MFRHNQRHQQVTLFGTVHQMPVGVKKMMDRSWAPAFRRLIFENIDERRYAELYSTVESRPNFPVNIWVGLEIIKWVFDYTGQELLEQFHFNLLTAYSLEQLGIDPKGQRMDPPPSRGIGQIPLTFIFQNLCRKWGGTSVKRRSAFYLSGGTKGCRTDIIKLASGSKGMM